MNDYFPEALFAYQNDFDHISSNISYNKSKIPDMINIIGPNAFENDPKTYKEANKEIHNLFLAENYQYFVKQPKVTETSNENQSFILPDFGTESDSFKNEISDTSNVQFEEEEQNEMFQLFQEIDRPSNNHKQEKKAQYPLESLVQKDFLRFNVNHFFSFFS